VDLFTVAGEPGDVFLLCSDGLSSMVPDEQVASTIEAAERDPERAAESLVAAANARGGEDNITVVIFELVRAGEPASSGEDAPVGEDAQPAEDTQPELASPVAASADAAVDGTTLEESPSAAEPPAIPVETSRHGAGSGGRIAAIALLAAVLVLAILVLYAGLTR
jgi:protein phosphatase